MLAAKIFVERFQYMRVEGVDFVRGNTFSSICGALWAEP